MSEPILPELFLARLFEAGERQIDLHPGLAQRFGRGEHREFIHQPGFDELSRQIGSALDQESVYAAPAQLFETLKEIDAPWRSLTAAQQRCTIFFESVPAATGPVRMMRPRS